MRRKLLPLILGGALSIAAVAPAVAHTPALGHPTLAGLVNVLVVIANNNVEILNDSRVQVITVEINDSFNNILRNADIDILNNFLNNSLNDLTVTITDIQVVRGDVIITLLSGDTIVLH